MATAVARPLGGLVVPARFQNRGVTDTLGEGISSGFPILRIRGSKWRLSTGKDEEHTVPYTEINVVILRSPSFASRAYYKGYKGAGSKGERPLCASLHGIRPDADVQEPQSELCGTCPRNTTYVNEKGIKVRDCSNGKRLAVLCWLDWTAELLGKPLLKPTLLRVPGASLQALKAYGEELGRAGVPYYGLLTRLSFDDSTEYPKIEFNYNTDVQLDDDSAAVIDEMRETALAKQITGESAASLREVEPEQQAKPEVIQKPAPAKVSLAQAIKASKVDEETGETKEVQGEVLPPEKPKATKVKANGKAKAVATEQVVEATPEPEGEADDTLKAEVLKLLGK